MNEIQFALRQFMSNLWLCNKRPSNRSWWGPGLNFNLFRSNFTSCRWAHIWNKGVNLLRFVKRTYHTSVLHKCCCWQFYRPVQLWILLYWKWAWRGRNPLRVHSEEATCWVQTASKSLVLLKSRLMIYMITKNKMRLHSQNHLTECKWSFQNSSGTTPTMSNICWAAVILPVHLLCSSGQTLIMLPVFIYHCLHHIFHYNHNLTNLKSRLCRQTEHKEWILPCHSQHLSPPYCVFGQPSIHYWWDRAGNKPDNVNK